MMDFSLEEGEFLVKLARRTIEEYLKSGRKPKIDEKSVPEKLRKKAGAFVTLDKVGKTLKEKELRGCIGFIEPIMPLYKTVIEAAVAAATQDPRFEPVKLEEMDNIIVEVTILTPPELIKVKNPREYLKHIEIGKHGLIVEYGIYKGLLLPQVPVEYGWSKEEFLSHTCMKAGLLPDCWLDENVKIYRFSGIVFSEEKPRGKVVRRELMSC